jgi:O-antigen/teichoic acid export membrane protein
MTEALWIRLKTLPVLIALLLAGFLIVLRGGNEPMPTLIAFGAASLLLGLHTLPVAALRGNLGFRQAAAFYAAGRWASALLALLAFVPEREQSRLEVLALAVLAGEAVTLVLAGLSVRRTGRNQKHELVSPESFVTLRAALPFATNSLLGLVYNRLDVIILAALSSQAQLALYAPASRIQDALYLLPASISVVSLPVISNAWTHPDGKLFVQRFLRRILIGAFAISVPITVVFFVLTPQIIDHVLGSSYQGTTTPMRILVWFLPLAALTAPLLAALAGTGRAGESTKVFAIAFAVAMVLHFSLDWWWGATGAAVASFARDPGAFLLALVLAARFGLVGWRDRPRAANGGVDASH